MSEILVRLDGAVEKTLELLVEAGFFKTKSDAVRAGILRLGSEYHAVKSKEEYMDELACEKMERAERDVREGKTRLLTEKEVADKYGF